MSKGIAPKVKRTTLTKDAKINKVVKQNTNITIKKDLKQREKRETWSKRLNDISKEKERQEKILKSKPLSCFDVLEEQLEKIEVKPVVTRPDTLNPHLKRVVSNRGRKQALKKEQDQFLKVMNHPVFKTNPLGAIGKHLSNSMNQINSLPKNQ